MTAIHYTFSYHLTIYFGLWLSGSRRSTLTGRRWKLTPWIVLEWAIELVEEFPQEIWPTMINGLLSVITHDNNETTRTDIQY